MKRRILSLLLALCMVLSLLPATVFAAEETTTEEPKDVTIDFKFAPRTKVDGVWKMPHVMVDTEGNVIGTVEADGVTTVMGVDKYRVTKTVGKGETHYFYSNGLSVVDITSEVNAGTRTDWNIELDNSDAVAQLTLKGVTLDVDSSTYYNYKFYALDETTGEYVATTGTNKAGTANQATYDAPSVVPLTVSGEGKLKIIVDGASTLESGYGNGLSLGMQGGTTITSLDNSLLTVNAAGTGGWNGLSTSYDLTLDDANMVVRNGQNSGSGSTPALTVSANLTINGGTLNVKAAHRASCGIYVKNTLELTDRANVTVEHTSTSGTSTGVQYGVKADTIAFENAKLEIKNTTGAFDYAINKKPDDSGVVAPHKMVVKCGDLANGDGAEPVDIEDPTAQIVSNYVSVEFVCGKHEYSGGITDAECDVCGEPRDVPKDVTVKVVTTGSAKITKFTEDNAATYIREATVAPGEVYYAVADGAGLVTSFAKEESAPEGWDFMLDNTKPEAELVFNNEAYLRKYGDTKNVDGTTLNLLTVTGDGALKVIAQSYAELESHYGTTLSTNMVGGTTITSEDNGKLVLFQASTSMFTALVNSKGTLTFDHANVVAKNQHYAVGWSSSVIDAAGDMNVIGGRLEALAVDGNSTGSPACAIRGITVTGTLTLSDYAWVLVEQQSKSDPYGVGASSAMTAEEWQDYEPRYGVKAGAIVINNSSLYIKDNTNDMFEYAISVKPTLTDAKAYYLENINDTVLKELGDSNYTNSRPSGTKAGYEYPYVAIIADCTEDHSALKQTDCTVAVNCPICQNEQIAAKKHTYGEQTNCTVAVNCDECGEEVIPAKPHAFDNNCATADKCENCEAVAEAKDHVFDNDCTTDDKCANCEQKATAAGAHVFDNDCTTDDKCANCEQKATAADAHVAGEDDGDCTTAVKCVNCEKNAIEAKSHDFDADPTTDDTCKNEGCKVTAGIQHTHEYTEVVYDATGHWTKCSCGAVTEKVDHDCEEDVHAPDCVNGGYTIFTCDCGYSYRGAEVAPNGHTAGTPYELVGSRVDATLNNSGSYVEITPCAICSVEISRKTVVLPQLTGAVAEVNGTKYATLEAAIAAGGEVKLLKDLTVAGLVKIDKAITLDLNGNTITRVGKDHADTVLYITANDVTIKNGNVVAEGKGIGIYVRGTTVIENVKVTAGNVGILADVNMTVKDSVVTATYDSAAATGDGIQAYKNAVVSVENTTVTGSASGSAVEVYATATVTIDAKSVIKTISTLADIYSAEVYGGKLIMNGTAGRIRTSDEAADCGADTVVIGANANVDEIILDAVDVTVEGAENLNVTTPIADHKVVYKDGVYTVVAKDYVAQVGDDKFESLQEAIDAADGKIVTLLTDITVNSDVTIEAGKVITIDLAGNDMTAGNDTVNLHIYGKLTIKDLVGGGVSTYRNHFVHSGAELVVDGGTLQNISTASGGFTVNLSEGNATATINGGTVQAVNDGNYAVKVVATSTLTVNNGTIKGNWGAIHNTGVVVIKNGTIEVTKGLGGHCIYAGAGSTTTISGGVFTPDATSYSYAIWVDGDNAQVAISDGTFNMSTTECMFGSQFGLTGSAINVTGGKFAKDVSDYIAEGEHTKKDGNYYVICDGTAKDAVKENVKKATCTEDGSYDLVTYCDTCDKVLEKVTVPVEATGHAWDNEFDTECNNGCGTTREAETYANAIVTNGDSHGALIVDGKTVTLKAEGTIYCKKSAWDTYGQWVGFKINVPEGVDAAVANYIRPNGKASKLIEVLDTGKNYANVYSDMAGYGDTATYQLDWNGDGVTDLYVVIDVTGATLAHEYTSVVTKPTCTEKGYTTYTCACGKTYTADEVPATNHENAIDVEGEDATCTEAGKTDGRYCPDCQTWPVPQETIPATNHKNAIDVEGEDATCTEAGKTDGRYCPDCQTWPVPQETIPATGHTFTAKTVADEYLKSKANINSGAVYYYSCKDCGLSSKGQDGEATFVDGAALTGAIAEIDGYYYASLEDAIKNAEDGDKIVLQKNTNGSALNIDIKKSITIDFNGKALTVNATENAAAAITIANGTNVTFIGGRIVVASGSNYTALVDNAGTFTATDMDIRGTNLSDTASSTLINNGTMTIDGESIVIANATSLVAITNKGKCTIDLDVNSTEVSSRIYGSIEQVSNSLHVDAIKQVGGNLQYTEGTVTRANANVAVYAPAGYCWNENTLQAHSFVRNPEAKYLKTPATINSSAVYYESCEICGEAGTNTFEYGAKLSGAIAKMGDVYYATLGEALNAAKGGETIELLKNTNCSALTIGVSVTIKFNGKSLTVNATENVTTAIAIADGVEVKFEGGRVVVGGRDYTVLVENKGIFTATDMDIRGTNLSDTASYVLVNNGKMTIEGKSIVIANAASRGAIDNKGECTINLTVNSADVDSRIYGNIMTDAEKLIPTSIKQVGGRVVYAD